VAKRAESAGSNADLGTILGEIAHDAKKLLSEQIDLFRAEVGQELRQVGGAAASVAAGGGLAVAGGLMAGLTAVHVLHRATGLPLWACYGLATAGLGGAAAGLLLKGRAGLAGLRPLPETTAALGENLEWLKDRLNPAGG
jgi:hypothetical protein